MELKISKTKKKKQKTKKQKTKIKATNTQKRVYLLFLSATVSGIG